MAFVVNPQPHSQTSTLKQGQGGYSEKIDSPNTLARVPFSLKCIISEVARGWAKSAAYCSRSSAFQCVGRRVLRALGRFRW